MLWRRRANTMPPSPITPSRCGAIRVTSGHATTAGCRRVRRSPQALAHLSEAIRLDATNAAYREQRGLVHLEMGEFPGAIADLNEGIRLDANRAPAFFHRAQAHLQAGAVEKALSDL